MSSNFINTSIFEIFKIGPGPSSSHTIAPLKIGHSFYEFSSTLDSKIIKKSVKIRIELFGSLSLTGRGHGTHRAIVGGLLGMTPESCDPDILLDIFEKKDTVYNIQIGDKTIPLVESDLIFSREPIESEYSNTLRIKLLDADGKTTVEKEYYSVGGGFTKCKGEAESIKKGKVIHKYSNFNELRTLCEKKGLPLSQVILENEMAISSLSKKEIFKKMKKIINVMLDSVDNGLNSTQHILPGPIKLERRASTVFKSAKKKKFETTKSLTFLNSYSLAASEENAAGRIVVTAPTSGSSGILPGVIYFLRNNLKTSKKSIINAMFNAAAIAYIARENASIAGADVGCQGEVGVASSMAAALISTIDKQPLEVIENSATIALEHFLGLTCDPVGGYVQVPCIERNAVGAVAGYNAYILAFSKQHGRISFDEVVRTMLETGRDMNEKYRETAKGGLAIFTSIGC
ncbi:MAG: L-serine ammonia-lyase [Helicobacteraceae bacterium]|nr:L-serine ammonia-lyase [Helicobacteraceae bacterium]